MQSRNIVHIHYLIAICSLYNLQTGLRNAIEAVIGVGGTDNKGEYVKNAMQIIYGAYKIQNWQETEELKELWKYVQEDDVNNQKFKKIEVRRTSFVKMVVSWRMCVQF